MRIVQLILACLAIGFIWVFTSENDIQNDQRLFKKEGIGNALNSYFLQRAYPYDNIPTKRIQQAYQKFQQDNQIKSSANPWELMGPENFSGRTLCLAFNNENPNTLFAGSASGGLWRSYTLGAGAASWHQVNFPAGSNSIGSIATHPTDSNIIIVGTGEVYNYQYVGSGEHVWMTRGIPGVGMFKTTDYGATWTQVQVLNLDDLQSFNMIKYDPNNSNIVYAGGTNGLYKSTDAGDSWTQIYSVKNVTDLIIQPGNSNNILFSCGNLGSPNGGVYLSTDGGSNFTLTSGSFPSFNGKIMLTISPDNSNLVAASVGYPSQSRELFTSTNFGSSWTPHNIEFTYGWYAHDLVFEPGNSNSMVCAGVDIYKYTLNTQNLSQKSDWTQWDDNPPINGPGGPADYVHGDIHDIIYHPTNTDQVFFATDGGVFMSDNDAETFTSRNAGLVTTQFYSGMASSQQNENYFIGGLQDNGTVRYNGDGQWKRILGGDGAYAAINPDNDSYVFGSTYNLIMYRSTDGGQNFNYVNDIPYHTDANSAFISPFEIAQSNPSVMYGATDQVFASYDNGQSWSTTGGDIDNGKTATDLAISKIDDSKFYVATCPLRQLDIGQFQYEDRSRLFVTNDGGMNYQDITGDLPDRFITDVDVSYQDDNIVYVTLSGYGTEHIYRTFDGGQNWYAIDGNQLPDVPFNTIEVDPYNFNIVYAGCDFGMYYSDDYGVTWTAMNDGLPSNVIVMDISYQKSGKKLRIGTHGNGAYQTDLLSNTNMVGVNSTENRAFDIYPNPAQDFIRINQPVESVQIFDMQGKLLINSNSNYISIENLTQGTYLIQADQLGTRMFVKN